MSNKHPLISIIIRGKNESNWLKILFKELQNQKYQNFEIIYCDNLSTDNSIAVAKKFKVKKIIKILNYTPGSAINQGIKRSLGQFIVILSSHCIPCSKNWLLNYVNFMNKNPKLVAAYGRQIPLPGTSTKDLLDLDIVFSEKSSINQVHNYLNNANSIYKAEHLKKNLFDKNLKNIEDRKWAIDQKKNNFKIGYLNNAEVFHIHGINQHNSSSERSLSTSKILMKKYNRYWKQCGFIKENYFQYAITINARRKIELKKLKIKIKKLISKNFFQKLNIKKIFVISEYNFTFKFKNARVKSTYPKESLSDDLKNLYKENLNNWIDINYIIALNASSNWNQKYLKQIIINCIKNSYDSVTLAEKIYGNFIIKFEDGGLINSLSLDRRENKPHIFLMKWTEGCIFTPNYLIEGRYVNEKTKLLFK
jgi:rhamnosyltransferase